MIAAAITDRLVIHPTAFPSTQSEPQRQILDAKAAEEIGEPVTKTTTEPVEWALAGLRVDQDVDAVQFTEAITGAGLL